MVEVHKRLDGPQPGTHLVTRDDLAGPLQQHSQDLKGLILEFDFDPVAAQFSCAQIHLEDTETDRRSSVTGH